MKFPRITKIIISLVVSIGGVIGMYYATYRAPESAAKKMMVVIYPTEYTTADRICEGITEALAASAHSHRLAIRFFGIDVLDKIRTLATVETVFEQKPDVILSVGGTATLALSETMKKRSLEIPVVFAGVPVAVEWGLVESYERPGGLMTGIDSIGEVGSNIKAKLLCLTKPTLKKVLIPYIISSDPRDTRSEDIAAYMKKYLSSQSVEVTLLGLNGGCNVLEKVETMLPGHDMLCSLENDSMSSLNSGFSKLCSEMRVTFFCGVVDMTLDAALSFGLDPKPIGKEMFYKASEILFEGKIPATMPVSVLTVFRELYINLVASAAQGYRPHLARIVKKIAQDPELSSLLNKIHIVPTHARCN
jgi:putative ABC transport system substrate-binding protein